MLQKITITIIICLSLFVKLNAQTWTFAGAAGSANAENTKAICTDAAGNVYLTGSFSNTVDFDFGAGIANLTSNGSNDIFIASYTSAGAYRWAVRAGGTGNDNGLPNGGICTDGTNVYVTGSYNGAATLFGATSLTPNGGSGLDAYVAKLNASTGAWIWANTIGGTGSIDSGTSICLDAFGNPYLLGYFNFTLGGSCANVSSGGSDVFVSKLNPSTGACVWTSSGGSTGNDGTVGGGICYDPTTAEIIVSSNFTTGTATFGGFSVPWTGGIDMCVLELNSSTGAWLGAVGCGSATNDDAVACALDPVTGDVMICGAITGNVTLPGGISLTASSAGFQDAWIGRYSIVSNGFTWAKSATGTANDRAHSVAVDGVGTAVMVGQYLSSPTVFGSQSLTNTNSGGFDEAFVVAYSSSSGSELWSTKNTNTGTQNTATNARSISYVGSNNYWIAGQNVQGTTFGSTVLNSSGFNDFYIAKYNAPVTCSNPTIGTQPTNKSVCFNGSTSFSISATGASGYQWQENTGSGFTNITNGGVYSGATTSTLSLTGINFASGYLYRCIVISGACQTISNSVTLTVSAYFNTASQINVSCNGGSNGSATLSASGGIAPYNYSWAPSGGAGATASSLSVGVYTVTVTDAIGCSTTKTYTITQPSAIATSTSVTNVSCNGGSNGVASVSASGGAGGYSYSWAPSGGTGATASGLSVNNYTVTVTDANNCTRTAFANVTQPTAISITPSSQTNISCNGGSNGAASINTPTGGAGGYTYNWTPGNPTGDGTTSVSGLTIGTWTCTVTDANACTRTQTFNITQPTSALSASNVVTNISCFGGSNGAINLTPAGGTTAYTFNWGGGVTSEDRTGLLAGAYTCTITDANGCTTTSNATVTQPASALSASNVVTNISCFGGSNGAINLIPTGGTTAYTFNWGGGVTTEDRTGLLAGAYTCTITDANGCTTTSNATVTQPAVALTASNVVTNISCFGGSNGAINLTSAGGTAAYTFNWGGGITTEDRTGLLAGAYTCTITDANGCTTTSNATVTQPSALITSTAVANIACNGDANGVASIANSGGTGGYTYAWSNGASSAVITGLLPGVYTATVTDANGCMNIRNATITQPSALITSTAVTNIACNGGSTGSASVAVSGGISPYTYLWSSAQTTSVISGQIAGVRTVTVTDANGCASSKSVSITQPASALSASNVVTNISCFGGSNGAINLTPAGGTAGYTFLWNTGHTTEDRTGILAGAYTCTITDANGCITTSNATITQPASALSTSTAVANVSCNGGSNGSATVTASGGTSPYTYLWSSAQTTSVITGQIVGVRTVTVTDANGCTSSKSISITQPASALSASNVVTNIFCFGGSNGSINLTPAGGTLAYSFNWGGGITTEDRTGLLAGAYTCTITDANGCTTTSNATVTQPASALATSTAVTNVYCNGGSNGSATVTASGGTSPYTYLWSSAQTTSVISGQTAGVRTVTVTDANGCTSSKSISITQPASALSASNVVTNISCFGGSNGAINLTPAGGTAAYTFNWGAGITTEDRTGLLAGAYTCTITDANGCITTSNATVTQPVSAIAATITSTNTACLSNTGIASVSASGGTPGYTYSWTPSGGATATASSLGVGTYSCVINDANLCSITKTINITTSGAPTATIISQTNVTCNSLCNGSATVSASGGTTPYNYIWSNGNTTTTATNLCAGVITCTVTGSNGCSTVVNTTITQPTTLSANATASAILCNGGVSTITVTATGGTSSYTGVGTFTTLAGTKTYTVTDANGCSTTTSITITQPTVLSANSFASSILCNGGVSTITVSATGGTPAYSGVGTFTTLVGTKTYTVTDANGCSTTTSISVSEPSVLTANASASSILCNGSVSTITVTATGGTSSYTGVGTFTTLAGTKTYTVTDANGCSATTSITVSEPSVLTANASASSVLCNGGVSTITVSATGGTTSYSGVGTFTANAGIQNYTVTDANGCSTTTSVSITEPIALVSSQSLTLCAGQSITVGTSTYNTSGTYTNVLSAINGCDSTVTTNLIVNPAIVSSQTVTLCAGQSLTIGSNTYTATGIYTNTFTAINGCDSTLTTDLTINPVIVSSQTVTLCAGQSLTVGSNTYTTTGIYTNTFTAVSGCDSTITTNLNINNAINVATTLNGLTISANESSATYQWIDCNNSNQPITGETNQSFTASANGNYAVIVTQNTCFDTSACVNISTVGVKDVNDLAGFKLYPNPTNNSFIISGLEINTNINIYNTIGELVKSIQSTDNNTTIDLSNYSNGIYFIKTKSNKGEATQKLIKQ